MPRRLRGWCTTSRGKETQRGAGKGGLLPGMGKVPLSPERAARLKRSHTDWMDALPKLEFAKLSREGQVDYLLFKNQLERERRRLDLQGKPAAKVAPKKDES